MSPVITAVVSEGRETRNRGIFKVIRMALDRKVTQGGDKRNFRARVRALARIANAS